MEYLSWDISACLSRTFISWMSLKREYTQQVSFRAQRNMTQWHTNINNRCYLQIGENPYVSGGYKRTFQTIVMYQNNTEQIIFFFLILFIYLFMAVLGLRFCARAFPSCGKRGPLFIAVRRPLTIAASLVAEHRLQTRRLSSCGSWA